MTFASTNYASPVGMLKLVASDRGLAAILWENDDPDRVRLGTMTEQPDHPVLVETMRQLSDYFAGTRTHFDLPLDFHGTDFQKRVWKALLKKQPMELSQAFPILVEMLVLLQSLLLKAQLKPLEILVKTQVLWQKMQ